MNKVKGNILTRTRIAFLAMLVFGMAITYRLVHIQFLSTKDWKKAAEEVDIKLKNVKANRGNIYSDNGSLLATSLPFYYVAFDPSVSKRGTIRKEIFNNGIDSLCDSLARYFGNRSAKGYKQYILAQRARDVQYMRFSSQRVNYHDKKKMEKWPIFREGQMKGGVIFDKIDDRNNPFVTLAYRTIGDLKQNGRGRVGLEYSFDSVLAGKNGKALYSKIGSGRWKPIRDEQEIKPEDGFDIVTTIDINMQDIVENALREALETHQADNGCVIVMEVKTGEIKAITNLDKVTRTNKKTGVKKISYREIYNYAIAKRFEPGSTFKLASMMAILEENGNNLKLTDSVDCAKYGNYKFFDKWMYDSHGIGKVSVKDVFAYSSNIGIAKLAMETFYQSKETQQKFSQYFTDFGLREPLGFQIKGAATTNIKTPDSADWSGVSIPWMSHGYELEITPLQLLSFYNAVANDGKMLQPIIVKEVKKADQVEKKFEPKVIRKSVCSGRTLNMIQEMLMAVTEYGTAKSIKSDEYKIAGKTGTAKQYKKEGGYTKKIYYASFAGYFPAENPKYSCIVVVDNPQNGKYYGSDVAAPVFRKIADNIYRSDLELHPFIAKKFQTEKGVFPVVQSGFQADLDLICQKLNLNIWQGDSEHAQWVDAKRDDELKAIKWRKKNINQNEIPDVKGMTLRDALPLLENLGLRVAFEGDGRVANQSRTPGEELIVGSQIALTLEN